MLCETMMTIWIRLFIATVWGTAARYESNHIAIIL